MDELLQKLQTGSTTERISAAKAIGDLGDPLAIPTLRKILNELAEPYEKTDVIPGGWGNHYDAHPEQTTTIDPDKELRDAILTTLAKLK